MLIRLKLTVPHAVESAPVRQFMLDRGLAQNADIRSVPGSIRGVRLGSQVTGDFVEVYRNRDAGLTHESLLRLIGTLQKTFPGVGVAIEVDG